ADQWRYDLELQPGNSGQRGTRKRDDARADLCLQRQWNHVEKRDHRFDDLQHDGRRSALSGRYKNGGARVDTAIFTPRRASPPDQTTAYLTTALGASQRGSGALSVLRASRHT